MKRCILCLLFFIFNIYNNVYATNIRIIEKEIQKFNTTLKKHQIRLLAYTLNKGEKEFNINYKEIFSIIHIESNFKPTAKRKNNRKSIDYGLCQINNKNWKILSEKAKRVLYKYEIPFVDSYYDIALNTMCAFVYLNDNKNRMFRNNEVCYVKWIQSYNVGYEGAFSKNKNLQKIRTIYFQKFYKIRSVL